MSSRACALHVEIAHNPAIVRVYAKDPRGATIRKNMDVAANRWNMPPDRLIAEGKLLDGDHIASSITNNAIAASALSTPERVAVINALREKLGVDMTTGHAPWDDPGKHAGRYHPDGWRAIPHHVGPSPCLLITENAFGIWRCESGGDLLELLEDTPGFEFYVCDLDMNFLLCHNHHDYLIGWGDAVAWIDALEASSAPPNPPRPRQP